MVMFPPETRPPTLGVVAAQPTPAGSVASMKSGGDGDGADLRLSHYEPRIVAFAGQREPPPSLARLRC